MTIHCLMMDKDHALTKTIVIPETKAKMRFSYEGFRKPGYGNREMFTKIIDVATAATLADEYHYYQDYEDGALHTDTFDIVRSDGLNWQQGQSVAISHHVPPWDAYHGIDVKSIRVDMVD